MKFKDKNLFKLVFEDSEIAIYQNLGRYFCLFRTSFIDSENFKIEDLSQKIQSFIEEIESLKIRFVYSESEGSQFKEGSAREGLGNLLNLKKKSLFLVFEQTHLDFKFFLKKLQRIKAFKESIKIDLWKSLFSEFSKAYIKDLPSEIGEKKTYSLKSNYLESTDLKKIVVLKMNILSEYSVLEHIFASIKQNCDLDFIFVTQLKLMTSHFSEIFFRRRNKKLSLENDLSSEIKRSDGETHLAEVQLNSRRLVEFESFLILKERFVESKDFFSKVVSIKNAFHKMGVFNIESFGTFSCLRSSQLMGSFHCPLLELSHNIVPYLPLFTFGDEKELVELKYKSSLILTRKDSSLSEINIFDETYSSSNTLIIGKTGSGKSILTGLLLEALIFSGECQVTLVDVGGSYMNLVERLGGQIKSVNLEEPSGINPFSCINSENLKEENKVLLLASFLENLVKNEDEKILDKDTRHFLEASILNYIKSHPQSPSFLDFFKSLKNKGLIFRLRRYSDKGIYHNAFKTVLNDKSQNFLTYYNFQEIFQANDKNFSKAIIAAVVTGFSIQLLSENNQKKLLIMDECPFFVLENYEFLKLMASNIRKFGGALCLISQRLSDLYVNDDKLLSQFSNKFLFSVDGSKEDFILQSGLSESEYEQVKQLRQEKRRYSEVLYKDQFSSKVLTVELTPKEYWRLTSDYQDKLKIKELSNILPAFKREDILNILSYLDERGTGGEYA